MVVTSTLFNAVLLCADFIGIPLSYFGLLYTSIDKIVSGDIASDIVCTLCEDYTRNCWYVLLLSLLLSIDTR
jgi:hypothetical protein